MSSPSDSVAREATVVLEPGCRVIADLHLDPGGDDRLDQFCAWCADLQDCPRLIVLGDLFDVWVGPAQADLAGSARVLRALADLNRRACRIDVVPGNRDFLMGERFERESGAVLRLDGFVGAWAGAGSHELALFIHGDELCTLDLPYQRMKRVLRSRPMKLIAPRLPLPVARWAAGRLRKRSKTAVAQKRPETTEIQESACRELALESGASTVICGHAHLWRDQQLPAGPRWIVLDAWGGARDVLIGTQNRDWSAVNSRS
ncbi:MAG: UDP-2,3-diacylglucosamine hydrolase [Planctomycetota bacterium]|jgi:UDP-2,3-diacylglucosamine hydrolase